MQLPSHIVQLSSRWYFNTKSQKYIHSDKIENYLDGYYHGMKLGKTAKKASVKYKKEVKLAKRRWSDED